MASYPGYAWVFYSTGGSGVSYYVTLQTYQPVGSVIMIASLVQSTGGSQPNQTLATFQVCPGTQSYTQGGQTLTITWDGTLVGAQPQITIAQGVPYLFVAGLSQATNSPLPVNYTAAQCGTPTAGIPVIVSTYYAPVTGTLTIYTFNSTDTNQPQGYLMTTPPVPLYSGGYTNPSPLIFISWNGVVSSAVPPTLTLAGSGSGNGNCTTLAAQSVTASSIASSSLPNSGQSNGATLPVQSAAPNCPIPAATITATGFNYTVNTTNDLRIITYTNTSSGATGAFVASYPGTNGTGIPLCNGYISPYQNLFINWDGSGLTSSSIVVTYNCTVLQPSVQTITGLNPANLPSGPGTCTTATPNCGGGGGGGGGKKMNAWIWWVIGAIIALLIIGGIVALVIVLHHKHGSLETPVS